MSKLSPFSLRSRAIILVLLAIFPLVALTLYSYFDQRDRAIREVQRDELVAARNLATIQETVISDARQLLATLAQLPQVKRRDRDACNALFTVLLRQSPHSATIGATDSEGRLFASAPAAPGPVNYADRLWFQKVSQARDLVVGETVVGRISGKFGNNLAYPIWDDEGRFQGALTTQLNLPWLGSLLAKSDFPPTTAMVLTDSSRKVLFRHPDPLKYIGKMLPDSLVKAMTISDEGVAAGVGLPGDARLFAFARLSPPWQEMWVFIGLPRDWAVSPVNRALWRNLIWLGLVAIFAMAAAWFGGDIFIVRPVKKLRTVIEQLAAGDLTVRAGPDNPEGELGILALSFDQMADSLQERQEDLRRAKDELEQRVLERTAELRAANEHLLREVEDRQLAEQQAESLGRLYRLLSRVNEMIVRAQEPEELFQQACRIMMEEGDFLLCWVGRVDWEAGVVRAAAQYDPIDDYPPNITISLADDPEGHGPTGVAVREGRWDVCLDFAGDPRMAPWREQGMARGFRSSAAFPLFVGGKVEGVLTLYSGQVGFFNRQEVELLNSLAQDLSFAMESMQREARRRQAEKALRESEENLRFLSSQLLTAQERERKRISRELHDDLGQSLSFLKLQLRGIETNLPPNLMEIKEHSTHIRDHLNEVIEKVRRISRDLSPSILVDLGLPAALRNLSEEFGKYHKVNLSMEMDDIKELFSPEDEINLYRIFQESLNNIAKHTQADQIGISIKKHKGCVTFNVEDNGAGFDVQNVLTAEATKKGMGLTSMEERVRMLGGDLKLWSQPGRGTKISFTIPSRKSGTSDRPS